MPRGAHALLDLPAETVALLRSRARPLASEAFFGIIAGGCVSLLAGFVLGVAEGTRGAFPRTGGVFFIQSHPIAWPALALALGGVWTVAILPCVVILSVRDPADVGERIRLSNAKSQGLLLVHAA